jgi:hypothetical protein
MTNPIMKIITCIRIFICFPFFGILIPDLAFYFSQSAGNVPVFHLLTALALLLAIGITFIIEIVYVRANADRG